MDLELDVIVTDEFGNVILSSLASGSVDAEGHRRPVAVKKSVKIDTSKGFSRVENENGNEYLLHRGTLNSFLSDFSIVPVPGGVGPMTITMLLWNTLESARR